MVKLRLRKIKELAESHIYVKLNQIQNQAIEGLAE